MTMSREQEKEYLDLRDKFAAAALTGLLASGLSDACTATKLAYRYADIMLEEKLK